MTHNTRHLRVISAFDLLGEEIDQPPFLVDGLLPAVGTALLAGPPKSYKTLFALQVATAVSAGLPGVIDRSIKRHGPVLFIEEEGGRLGLRTRLSLVLDGLGVPPAEAALSFAVHEGVRLDDESWLQAISAKLDQLCPVMVVLDPLAFLHEGEENSNTDMARVMKSLVRLAHTHQALILAIHHVSKPGERSRGRATDQLRGASALGGATDANLILKKRANATAMLTGEFRDSGNFELGLEFDEQSLLLSAMASMPAASPRKVNPVEAAALVQAAGVAVPVSEAAHVFGVARNTAKDALLEAANLGLVEHRQHPARGHQFWFSADDLAA